MKKPVSYEAGFLKDGYFGIHGGVAIPLGDFANKDLDNKKSGYADLGYTINLDLKYAFIPYLGINLKYFYSSNPFDAGNLQSDFNTQPNRDVNINYSSGPWVLQGFLIMPMFIWRSDKQAIDLSAGAGWVDAALPSNTIYIMPLNPAIANVTLEQDVFSNAGFGFSAAIGWRYKLFGNFIGSAKMDYTYADITFTNLTQTVTGSQGSYVISVEDYSQPFSIIHLSAGIGYQFD